MTETVPSSGRGGTATAERGKAPVLVSLLGRADIPDCLA